MLNADVLTFNEFVKHEPLPLSKIQQAVLEFLQGRDDAVLFGAQAVNAYVSEPRATQDVDIMSTRAKELAKELGYHLGERFHIAVRIREVAGGKGIRIYQVRKEGNRHLVDLRPVIEFPETQAFEEIRVLSPEELIASKVISYISRFGKSKSWTDRRDLTVLLLRFPELKTSVSKVQIILKRLGATKEAFEFWDELVASDIEIENDDDLNF